MSENCSKTLKYQFRGAFMFIYEVLGIFGVYWWNLDSLIGNLMYYTDADTDTYR